MRLGNTLMPVKPSAWNGMTAFALSGRCRGDPNRPRFRPLRRSIFRSATPRPRPLVALGGRPYEGAESARKRSSAKGRLCQLRAFTQAINRRPFMTRRVSRYCFNGERFKLAFVRPTKFPLGGVLISTEELA
jgi:hypothetical protein